MTREQYLNKEVSHQDYYASLAKVAGISFSDEFIRKVAQALREGDEHLNSIPLSTWDAMAVNDIRNPYLGTELKKRGDGYSLSTGVCMRKARAKELAEAIR